MTTTPTQPAPTGLRVLCVDDEPALVLLIRLNLQRLGHLVTGTTDPIDALARVRMDPTSFDAVLTDLSMPRMSGLELAREIHAMRPTMPVILLTGRVDFAGQSLGRAEGIHQVLTKPPAFAQLAELLARIADPDDRD